jgi:release factor glutamine methyltransferase
MPGNTVRAALDDARRRLGEEASARLDAQLLLAHALGKGRAWLFANPEYVLADAELGQFGRLLERRVRGEPVAYLTGAREFWSLPLVITADVLIPRPETELLVEVALDFIPPGAAWRIADLGTGSGAVALAIARERPECEVHATEISAAALAVARENGHRVLPGAVTFHAGSWLEPLAGKFRLLVGNPPYVDRDDPHLQQGDCRFEPRQALTPGSDGLSAIRAITTQAPAWLEKGGMLALEHGFDQGARVRELFRNQGFDRVVTHKDLEGLERVTAGVLGRTQL